MSFLRKLFGLGDGAETGSAKAAGVIGQEEYKGYVVKAIEMRAGSEYQLAGTIEKDVNGEHKTYQFVRADRFSSRDDAEALTLAKGRQIIDEQGEALFKQSWPHQPN